MQKFGEDGIEFWWNDDEGDLIYIFLGVLLEIGILYLIKNIHLSTLGLSFALLCFLLIGIFTVQLFSFYKKKIPQLYMNETGISIRDTFIPWDWITEITKKDVSGPRSFRPRYQIVIYYYAPGKKYRKSRGLLPDREELQELMDYIEAYWNYYKKK